jgi:hypothetical protein
MPDGTADVKLAFEPVVAEWRNWQTHQTQNLAKFTLRVGSTPTSATNKTNNLSGYFELLTRTDLIWITQLITIRVEDLLVLVGVAEHLLGNF